MKDLKHIKKFNESNENLNISDVIKRLSSLSSYTIDQVIATNNISKLDVGLNTKNSKWYCIDNLDEIIETLKNVL